MAVIKYIEVKKGNLKNAINYITRADKTDLNLIYCKDCKLNTIIEEFNYVKNIYNKKGGRQYYHFVQSFSKDDKIDYDMAKKIGQEMCEYFKDYQIIMTVHKDKDYIHNHYVMNSVNMNTGYMYHRDRKESDNIKILSNKICERYGLKQIDLTKKISKYMNTKEFYLSKKIDTEKKKLINSIKSCIKISKSKEQFIFKMNQKGYRVLWEEDRKYITYSTPDGRKFRDKRLGNIKYTKQRMENYFSRIKNIRKVEKDFYKTKSLLKNNKNQIKEIDTIEYSDIAKKEYIEKIKNASSIEWEE